MLQPGHIAPDFQANTWDNQPIQLSALREHKVWLAFFRYASCPLCNLRVRDIILRHPQLTAQNIKVLAVFQSPPETIAEYVGQQAPPFPLISDPDEILYKQYQLQTSLAGFLHPKNMLVVKDAMKAGFKPGKMDGSKTRIPGDFLITRTGFLADVFYGKVIADHIPFERVEAFAAANG
jgi:peroxiredoxin Q/BCP